MTAEKTVVTAVLNEVFDLLPELDLAGAVCSVFDRLVHVSASRNDDGNMVIKSALPESAVRIQHYRDRPVGMTWLDANSSSLLLPENSSSDPFTIGEFAIQPKSDSTGLPDILVFRFEKLTALKREWIEKLLSTIITRTYARFEEEQKQTELIKQAFNQVSNENKTLVKKNNALQKTRLALLNRICRFWLEQQNGSFRITNEAVEKLQPLADNYDAIVSALRNAIRLAGQLGSTDKNGAIIIEAAHIHVKALTEKPKSASVTTSRQSSSQAAVYLDRYEKAAKQVLKSGLKVNGKHVGLKCDPQVTPAAISFILKKHKKAMTTLLKRFPEKWPTLREHFRPLKSLVETSTADDTYQTGS